MIGVEQWRAAIGGWHSGNLSAIYRRYGSRRIVRRNIWSKLLPILDSYSSTLYCAIFWISVVLLALISEDGLYVAALSLALDGNCVNLSTLVKSPSSAAVIRIRDNYLWMPSVTQVCAIQIHRLWTFASPSATAPMLGLLRALKWLLIIAGDVELNPGPLPTEIEKLLPTVDTSILTESDIHDAYDEVVTLAGRWQSMCNGLKLLPSDRDAIAVRYPHNPENCLMEVLVKWLQKSYNTERYGPPTWRMLVAAVANRAGGDNPALAKQIAENHEGSCPLVQSSHKDRCEAGRDKAGISMSGAYSPVLSSHTFKRKQEQMGTGELPPKNEAGPSMKKAKDEGTAISEYMQYLRGRYQQQIPTVLTLQWPPLPTQKVLNLAMILGKNTPYGPIDEDTVRLMSLGKVTDILHRKTPIKVNDIFQTATAKRNVILIEGAPGAGKSTLAWHICQKWGAGELFPNFQIVVFIQLRDPAIQSAKSADDLLPAVDRNQAENILAELRNSSGKDMLFVMDGWDELPIHLHSNSIFYQLIASPETLNLHFSSVIVTSRPIASGDLYQCGAISARIEILGFTPTEVQDYFTEVLERDCKTVQKLQNQLRERPMIEASCYLPLNAAIVVHLFQVYNHSLPSTLHGVFTSLVLCCLVRYITKQGKSIQDEISSLDNLPPPLQESLKNISTLAYYGVMENKATFSAMDLENWQLPQKLDTLGLMQGVDSFTVLKRSVTYNFLHLSVQELLASLYISKLPEEKEIETFRKLFGQPRFASVFRFYAAFTKLETKRVREIVGDIVKRKEKTQLLYLLHGLYEAQNLSLCKFVGSQLCGELDFYGTILSPVDCLTVGFLIFCICLTCGDGEFKVDLHDCALDDYRVGFFAKEVGRCSSSVNISAYNLATTGAEVSNTCELNIKFWSKWNVNEMISSLAGFLFHAQLSFVSLPSLEDNKIAADGACALAQVLRVNQTIRTLNLMNNSISAEGAQAIGNALRVNQSLRILNLNTNGISDSGVITLAEALQYNFLLQELDLSVNDVSSNGAKMLGRALTINQSLKALHLGWNNIGNSGTMAIAEGLLLNTSLKELYLWRNDIADDGAVALSRALNAKVSLQILSLWDNKISDEGAKSIGKALKVNQSLTLLNLQRNNISDVGAKGLGEALRVNQSLATLKLWRNLITPEIEGSLLEEFPGRVTFHL